MRWRTADLIPQTEGRTLSYLRFTPQEYRALAQVCRPLPLDDDLFPNFKAILVQALFDSQPDLAKRVALFNKPKLRLLFTHFRERRGCSVDLLTPEEFRALAHACNSLVASHRFLHFYRNSLVRHFEDSRPALAQKLARMSEEQFRDLYGRIRERKRKG